MNRHLLLTSLLYPRACQWQPGQIRARAGWLRLLLLSLAVLTGPGIQPTNAQVAPTPAEDSTPTETTEPASLVAPVGEDPAPLSRSERNNRLLASAMADEVQWLDTPQGEILALFRPSANRMTRGVILLLHAAELPPGWPAPLENLRRNLPEYGWATLALSLPPHYAARSPARGPLPPPVPVAPSATAPPGEPAVVVEEQKNLADTPLDLPPPRAELIARRIAAALEFLRKKDQLRVTLIVDNSSVYESLQHLSATPEGGESPVAAMVLVNLQPQETLNNAQVAGIFSSPELPVMDVFLHPDSDRQILTRKRHRAEALRNKLEVYHQFVLPPIHSPGVDDARSFWLERVRGFIEKHAGRSKAAQEGLRE